jgi:hypothetical protein
VFHTELCDWRSGFRFAHLRHKTLQKGEKKAKQAFQFKIIEDNDPSRNATTELRSNAAGIPSSLRCLSSNSTSAHLPT